MSETITINVNAKLLTKRHSLRVKIAAILCRIASWLTTADVELTVDHQSQRKD